VSLILNVLLGSQKFYKYVKKNWKSMHRALKFISVFLEIISSMLFVRQDQKLMFTDLNSRGANRVNMPRNVSICINFPSLTCFKSHMFPRACFLWCFIFMSLVYLFDLHHWHTIFVYCLKNNISLYLFLHVQNTLYITTRLTKYCSQVTTSNGKQIQPLIIFLTYICHSTYLQVHTTCQGSCMFEG